MPDAGREALQRIETLTRTTRTNWLGLLAYLAFVGVTLMGVEDIDFFLPERQTALPLIGVTIPTALFFHVAPFLGAMLYIHLHLYLLKLWKALAETPPQIGGAPLGERISPWMISDMALGWRSDGARHGYGLRGSAGVVAFLSIFLAGPVVLGFFWWRSMPKHDEVLTVVFCGLPLFATLLTGWVSWRSLRHGTLPLSGRPARWRARAGWTTLAAALSLAGWFATEGTLERYFPDRDPAQHWWLGTPFPGLLVPAALAEAQFVRTPPGWQPRTEAFAAFRRELCRADGLGPALCGEAPEFAPAQTAPPPASTRALRRAWCDRQFGALPSPLPEDPAHLCAAFFDDFETRVRQEWRVAREAALTGLRRDFSGLDLRGADLRGARLVAADLSGARMERTDLSGADLEGAILRHARLEGAWFDGSRMETAHLQWARMNGADLRHVRLDGAELSAAQLDGSHLFRVRLRAAQLRSTSLNGATLIEARLEGANLLSAWLQEATLRSAHLDGANFERAFLNRADLRWVSVDADTRFTLAHLRGAALKDAELPEGLLAPDQLAEMFGDGSIRLPGIDAGGPGWPAHWPLRDLPIGPFLGEWQRWQTDPAAYLPP